MPHSTHATHSIEKIELALRGPRGPAVLRALFRLGMGEELSQDERAVLPILAELALGRATATGIVLDAYGQKCADAAREYVFWVERGRRIHGEDTLPALMLGNFENKRVLEIGPSWGCNLFRFQTVTAHARGREIDETYVRFTSIFAKLEGVNPPAIDVGGGEKLPYADGSFDWVVLFSAMQYMDVRAAVREIARVLAPGGRLLSSQPLLPTLVTGMLRDPGSPRAFARKLVTLANSLSYGFLGRRLRANSAGRSTSRPVYLTCRQIVSILEDAGLQFLPEMSGRHATDHILVAEKPRAGGPRGGKPA